MIQVYNSCMNDRKEEKQSSYMPSATGSENWQHLIKHLIIWGSSAEVFAPASELLLRSLTDPFSRLLVTTEKEVTILI